MAPQTDPNLDADDPPPSYAEATSTSRHRHRNSNSNRIDARRYTLANISSTIIHPVYSHVRSRIDGPVFPQAFSLYCQSLQHYTIGEGQMSPLYAVSTHGPGMQPDMVIHRGISRDSSLLAAIDHQPCNYSATITLPPRPGSEFPAAHELLESVGAFTRIMSFSIETNASGRARERFEWRHSHGFEVEALGGRHSGWKLVRMSNPPLSILHPSSLYAPLKRKYSSNVLGQSSDGKEVVAVWSEVSWSLTKVLRFRFLSTGADGSLGDRWAVMAVASALAIWHRDRRSRSVTGSAGF